MMIKMYCLHFVEINLVAGGLCFVLITIVFCLYRTLIVINSVHLAELLVVYYFLV